MPLKSRKTALIILRVLIMFAVTSTPMLFAARQQSIFVQANLGGGYGIYSEKVQGTGEKFTMSSPGGLGMFQAGGSLSRNVKFWGFVSGFYMPSPKPSSDSVQSGATYKYSLQHDLGLGMTFYTNSNFFLALGGSVASNNVRFVKEGFDVYTNTQHGWGAHATFGYEISLSAHLSWSLALFGYYGQVRDVGSAVYFDSLGSNMIFGAMTGISFN